MGDVHLRVESLMGHIGALLRVNKVRAHSPSRRWDEGGGGCSAFPFWTAPGSPQQHSTTWTSGGQAGSQTRLGPTVRRTPFPQQGGLGKARMASCAGHSGSGDQFLQTHRGWQGGAVGSAHTLTTFWMRGGKGTLAC